MAPKVDPINLRKLQKIVGNKVFNKELKYYRRIGGTQPNKIFESFYIFYYEEIYEITDTEEQQKKINFACDWMEKNEKISYQDVDLMLRACSGTNWSFDGEKFSFEFNDPGRIILDDPSTKTEEKTSLS